MADCEDLSAIHAAGFGGLAEAAADEVLGSLGEAADAARVLDIACGAGALAAPEGTTPPPPAPVRPARAGCARRRRGRRLRQRAQGP